MRNLLELHRKSAEVRFPLVGGHRGCVCEHQENTIPALSEGLAAGADYFEIDIQLTQDDVPIVYHDLRLEERTPLAGYVHEYTLEEIRAVTYVQTAQEVLRWGKEHNTWFALELKGCTADTQQVNKRLVPILNEVVLHENMLDSVYAFGLDYQVLSLLKKTNQDFEIGLICPIVPVDHVALMRSMRAMVYLSYVHNMNQEMVSTLQQHGYFVSGAILKDDKWVRRAVSWNVDMFEHDYPNMFKKEPRRWRP